ncbi:MAG: peptidase M61 [Bacteroidota bacterium]
MIPFGNRIGRKFLGLFAVLLLVLACGPSKNIPSAGKAPVQVEMDLVDVVGDRVQVIVDPGAFAKDQVSFFIPKTVPGTYSMDNYGQYIEGFKALDYQGKPLQVSKPDVNTWAIGDARNLDKVVYYVNDTYDTENEVAEAVFSPAGTNIMAGKNFVLNLHGFVGYFEGLKEIPYTLAIARPKNLKATTSLKEKQMTGGDPQTDVFVADRYFEVIDSPIQYASLDTESFAVNDIEVTLSVYSPNSTYTAAGLIGGIERMMRAQKAFLGDMDGTKEYNILLYLSTLEPTDAQGFGALEHHTSTVVVMPEAMPKEPLEEALKDVISHEFFHIVTPLNVHSEEVQYFDFNDPKMSRHLWMYEGTVEYFANLFQIQQGLIQEGEFYERLMDKVNNAKAYDDAMSFTEMSSNILEEPYKANYGNVYEKGALINMALDLLLREKSNGEKGVLWLMKELSRKYGDKVPFKDEDLIDEIVAMTYPEVRTFFDTYVIGNTPIDYGDFLAKVGLAKRTVEKQSGYFLEGEVPFIDVDQANGNAIFIRKGIALNSFFKDLGARGGDIIKSINGTDINLEAIRPIIGQSFGWTPETEISMTVERNGTELELKGKVGSPMLNVETIIPVEGAGENKQRLREAWLRG